MRLRLPELSVLLVVTARVVFSQNEDCSKFIVLDTAYAKSDEAVYQKAKQAFCRTEVNDRASAKKAGVEAGIPIPLADGILDLKLKGSGSSDEWSKWRSEFCQSGETEFSRGMATLNLTKTFGKNASETVQACLTNQNGFYGRFLLSEHHTEFAFEARYKSDAPVYLKEVTVSPNAVTGCNPANPAKIKLFEKRDLRAPISFTCSWNSSKDVIVTVTTRDNGAKSFMMPAMPIVLTPAPPKVDCWEMNYNAPVGHQGSTWHAIWQVPQSGTLSISALLTSTASDQYAMEGEATQTDNKITVSYSKIGIDDRCKTTIGLQGSKGIGYTVCEKNPGTQYPTTLTKLASCASR
jgi:hypothetical protein